MNRTMTIGANSWILLVAGVVLVFFDVWAGQVFIDCGFGITTNCGSSFFRLVLPIFLLAMVFLLPSAAGFLLLLNRNRESSAL